MLDIIKTSRWPYLLIAIIASFAEGSTFCLVSFSFLVSGVQVIGMGHTNNPLLSILYSHSLTQTQLREMHVHSLCGLHLYLL